VTSKEAIARKRAELMSSRTVQHVAMTDLAASGKQINYFLIIN